MGKLPQKLLLFEHPHPRSKKTLAYDLNSEQLPTELHSHARLLNYHQNIHTRIQTDITSPLPATETKHTQLSG